MKTIAKIIRAVSLFPAGLLFFAAQSQAWAHAFLDHAEPKVGSTVSAPPAIIKLWFTQHLEGAFSSVEVRDSHGREVDKKDARLDASDKSLLMVSVPPLPNGTYTVSWRVVSVDTHPTHGHFKFTVKDSAAGAAKMPDMNMGDMANGNSAASGLKTFPASGIVEGIAPDLRTATIHTATIPGYMAEMTMDYSVSNTNDLSGISRGDKISFTLVASNGTDWINGIQRTGHSSGEMTNNLPTHMNMPGMTTTNGSENGPKMQ
ncbi:MAG: copper resistance protein CopC [Limisphaerales bacterium]